MKKIKNFINTHNFAFMLISVSIFLACLCITSWSFVVECLKFCDRRPESMGVVITVVIAVFTGLTARHEYLFLKKKGLLRIYFLYQSIISLLFENITYIEKIEKEELSSSDFCYISIMVNNKKETFSKMPEIIDELQNLIYENGKNANQDVYIGRTLNMISSMHGMVSSINCMYDLLIQKPLEETDKQMLSTVIAYNMSLKEYFDKYYNEIIKEYLPLTRHLFKRRRNNNDLSSNTSL